MCVAILQPRNKRLKRKTLKRCWENNPDGGGFMYALDGEIIVVKELKKFDSFYSKFHNHRSKNNVDFILHFRIATHGLINEKNAHPHRANDSTWFVHNGIISQKCDANSKLSDTVKFSRLLGRLQPDFMLNDSVLELVREYIDTDKIIFLNDKGKIRIVNKTLGVKKYGCWFSNDSYKAKVWYNKGYYNGSGYGSGYGYNTGYVHGVNTVYALEDGKWKDEDFKDCDSCGAEMPKQTHIDYDGVCDGCIERKLILNETARLEQDGRKI